MVMTGCWEYYQSNKSSRKANTAAMKTNLKQVVQFTASHARAIKILIKPHITRLRPLVTPPFTRRKICLLVSVGLGGLLLLGIAVNRLSAATGPVLKDYLLITSGGDDPQVCREVSMISPHKAELRLFNLKPGKPCKIHWLLQDAQGVELLRDDFEFTPTQSVDTAWRSFQPDYKTHRAGNWTWKAKVDGAGRYSAEVTVLPPTPSEMDDLTHYEQAREEVFRAFAYTWLTHNHDYFTTIISRKNQQEYYYGGRQRDSAPSESLALLQVRDLKFSFSRDCISDADRLNGISYSGSATFGFSLYRTWTRADGWGDWFDTVRYPNEFFAALAQFVGPEAPYQFRNQANLQFRFECKDGHWRVWSDTGLVFVNGAVKNPKPGELKSFEVLQPKLEVVQSIASSLGQQRTLDAASGERVKASPEEIDRNTITTMTSLRGRTL